MSEELEKKSELIKSIWGSEERPRVIFLTDNTKISIDSDGRNYWLKIGKAAKIIAHDTEVKGKI